MTPTIAFSILLAVFVCGEIVAEKTRAILSTTLVVAVVLLVAFWCGLPADIFDTACVTAISNVLIGILITSLGTMIDLPELKRQWKTAVISLAGVVVGVALIILVAPMVIGREMALAGAPIFAGANAAALLMIHTIEEKGLTDLGGFIVLVLVTQNFIGIPIASQLLRRDARAFLRDPNNVAVYAASADPNAGARSKRAPLQLPALFDKPTVHLLKLSIVAALSQKAAALTQGKIHFFIFALLFGILFSELGFLDKHALSKTGSNTFVIFATTIIIFTNLAKTTPAQLGSMLVPLLVVLGTGVIGVCICGIVAAKLLKVSPELAISLGLSCTFGFPTTMLMSQEVAKAMASNEEERIALENYILPKMVTAGFVTVTIASVLIAGVIVTML